MAATKEPVELRRDLVECREGERAFQNGIDVDDCPYRIGDNRRAAWMTGWYDESIRTRLGHIWKKYGLAYP